MSTPEERIKAMVDAPDPGMDLTATLNDAQAVNPDQAAKQRRIAEMVDLPESIVEKAPEAAARALTQRQYMDLPQRAPELADWLRNPSNAKLAHDDVDALTDVADYMREFVGGPTGFAAAEVSGIGEWMNIAKRMQKRALKKIGAPEQLAEMGGPAIVGRGLNYFGDKTSEFVENKIRIPANRRTIGTDVTAGVGQLGGQIAQMLVAPQSALPSFMAVGTDQMADTAKRKGKYGEVKSDVAEVLGGGFTGLTEKWALGKIMERLPPQIKSRVLRYAADLGIAAGYESLQEMGDQGWQNLLTKALIDEDQKLLDGVVYSGGVAAGSAGIARAILLTLAPGRLRYSQQTQDAAGAISEAQRIVQASKLNAASKLATRDPAAFKDMLNAMGGDKPVGVSVEKLRTYAQSLEVDPGELAAQLGQSRAAYVEAEMTGGDLQVSMSALLASPHAEKLAADVRTTPGGMTATEANEWANTDAGKELKQMVDEAKAAAKEAEGPQRKIYDDFYTKLKGVNRGDEEADRTAYLMAIRFVQRAKILGKDPLELFEKNPTMFGDVLQQGPRVFEQDEMGVSLIPAKFVSPGMRTALTKLNRSGTAQQYGEQIKAMQLNGTFRRDEIQDSGILDWLAGHPPEAKLNRELIAAEFALRTPKLAVGQYVANTEASWVALDTRGIAMEYFDSEKEARDWLKDNLDIAAVVEENVSFAETDYRHMVLKGPSTDYRLLTFTNNPTENPNAVFEERHGFGDNVLAHARVDNRLTPQGQRVYFVNELQSGWVNAGNRWGFRGDPPVDTSNWSAVEVDWGLATAVEKFWRIVRPNKEGGQDIIYDTETTNGVSQEEAIAEARAAVERERPIRPKLLNTWQLATMKHLILDAIRQGAEFVAFPANDAQVAEVENWPEGHVEPDVMKNYTSTLPKLLNKFLQPYGAKIGEVQIEAVAPLSATQGRVVQGFPITGELRAAFLNEQVTLYQQPNLPRFFSPSAAAIEAKLPEHLTVTDAITRIKSLVQNQLAKKEELEDSGLMTWLEMEKEKRGKERISKREILAFLEMNQPQINFKAITKRLRGERYEVVFSDPSYYGRYNNGNLASPEVSSERELETMLSMEAEEFDEETQIWRSIPYTPEGGLTQALQSAQRDFVQWDVSDESIISYLHSLEDPDYVGDGTLTETSIRTERTWREARNLENKLELERRIDDAKKYFTWRRVAPGKYENALGVQATMEHRPEVRTALYGNYVFPGLATGYESFTLSIPDNTIRTSGGDDFSGMHFGPPNTFSHARIDYRETRDGKNYMMVNEIQSDWIQHAYTHGGFGNTLPPERRYTVVGKVRRSEYNERKEISIRVYKGRPDANGDWDDQQRVTYFDAFAPLDDPRTDEELIAEQKPQAIARAQRKEADRQPPEVPFKNSWEALTMKYLLAEAANAGAGYVAWPSTPDQVADVEQWPESYRVGGDSYNKVEQIVKRYTHSIPNFLNAYLKPFGVSVEQLRVPGKVRLVGEDIKEFSDNIDRSGNPYRPDQGETITYMDRDGSEFRAHIHRVDTPAEEAYRFEVTVSGPNFQAYTVTGGDNSNDAVAEALDQLRDRVSTYRNDVKPALNFEEDYVLSAVKITPEMREKFRGIGQPYYQVPTPKGARGAVQFGTDGTRYITLFKNANRSTVIHELAHTWLEELKADAALEDAPQQLKDDWATIVKWLGIDGEITVDQHETFARTGERYFMEGKAPSLKLKDVFRTLKAWMKSIYKNVKALNSPINDDVRAVFDRLLASDAEIAEAKSFLGTAKVMFATAKDMKISDALFASYTKAASEAAEREMETLEQGAIEEVTRETDAEWQALVEQETQAAKLELANTPPYRALNWLRSGALPPGQALALQHARLALDGVEEVIEDPAKVQALRRLGVVANAGKPGLHPEDVAPMLGFPSGASLLVNLINAPPIDVRAQQLAEQRMKDKHGDFLANAEQRADQALQAVHTDASGNMLRAELAALRRLHRESTPARGTIQREERSKAKEKLEEKDQDIAELREAISHVRAEGAYRLRWAAAEVNARDDAEKADARAAMDLPPLQAFSNMAKGIIDSTRAREVNPLKYLSAERKAAKEAYELALKKDYQAAATAKTRQLLNHFLYREALKGRRDMEKTQAYATRMGEQPAQAKFGKAGGQHQERLNELLERYEFRKISEKKLKRRDSLREWVATQAANGYEIAISDELLDDARQINYRLLTIRELREFNRALRSMDNLVNLKTKMRLGREEIEYEDLKTELLRTAQESFGKNRPPPIDPAQVRGWANFKDKMEAFDASLLKAEQVFMWLDSDNRLGPWARAFFRPMADAQNAEMEYTERFTETFSQMFGDFYGKRGRTKLMASKFYPKLNTTLSRQALLSLALNMGNDDNAHKLLTGYASQGWTLEGVQEALQDLTKEDWDFVQSVWNMVGSLWPDIVALERRTTGVEPKPVMARRLVTKFGEYAGGYFPVMFDRRFTSNDSDGNLLEPIYARATTDRGHIKARKQADEGTDERDAPRILLSLETIPQHMAAVIHDLTHREAVTNVNRLMQDKAIKEAITNRLGEAYWNMLNGWVRHVANDRNVDQSGVGFWLNLATKLRTNASIVAMGFKATTMAAQLAGHFQTLEQVNPLSYANAMQRYARHPLKMREVVHSLSTEMRHRNKVLERDMRDVYLREMGKKGFLSTAHRWAFKGIGVVDATVSIPAWMAAYEDAGKKGITGPDQVAYADSVVRLTQSYGATKDQAAVQRGNEFMKWGTMFYSYFNLLYNRLRSLGHVPKVGAHKFAEIAWRSLVIMIIPAIAGELLVGRGPDNDDEEKRHKLYEGMTGYKILPNEQRALWALRKIALYPTMSVPWLREVASSLDMGFESRTPLGALNAAIINAYNKVESAAAGNRKTDAMDVTKPVALTAGYLLGLPAAQFNITSEYLWDIWQGDERPETFLEFVHNLAYRREE